MSGPVVMLLDNGSRRASATLSLRAIAADLTAACGRQVHAVSVQHSDAVPADQLGGTRAQVLEGFLRARLGEGQREFVVLPLFFGMSRALTSAVPELVAELAEEFGPFDLRIAEVLSPLPQGESLLADILADNVRRASTGMGAEVDRVILVDHGSPVPEVTAVRSRLAAMLGERLDPGLKLDQAVMERRLGAKYDFNGELLDRKLDVCSSAGGGAAAVVLAMMFISPGRHAGPGGDIEAICAEAQTRNPGLQLGISPLIGEHALLLDILKARLEDVV